VSSPPPRGGAPGGGADPAGTPALRPGDRVEVELLESLRDGAAWVRLAGRRLLARFPGGFPQGPRVGARVVSTGPPLVLKAETAADAAPVPVRFPREPLARAVGAVLSAAPGPGDPPELAALQGLLRLPPDPASLAAALARWVRGSGVFHEAMLARGEAPEDLKALVVRVLARLPRGSLREGLEALLRHVEAFQARGVAEGTAVVPLVLPWGERWVEGDIAFEADRETRRGTRPRVSGVRVRLDLPSLGPVEVRVRWAAAGVSVYIAAGDRGRGPIRVRLAELREGLRERTGGRLVTVRVGRLPPAGPPPGDPVLEVRA